MAGRYPHTLRFLDTYGSQVSSEIKNRLKGEGKYASGKLYKSIGYRLKQVGDSFKLEFTMAEYGTYVDRGTGPSKYADKPGGGKGKSKFITSLKKWCRIRGLPESAAFAIRRKIWKYGLSPSYFFTIPTTRRRKQLDAGVKKSLALDLEMEIKRNVVESTGRSNVIKVR